MILGFSAPATVCPVVLREIYAQLEVELANDPINLAILRHLHRINAAAYRDGNEGISGVMTALAQLPREEALEIGRSLFRLSPQHQQDILNRAIGLSRVGDATGLDRLMRAIPRMQQVLPAGRQLGDIAPAHQTSIASALTGLAADPSTVMKHVRDGDWAKAKYQKDGLPLLPGGTHLISGLETLAAPRDPESGAARTSQMLLPEIRGLFDWANWRTSGHIPAQPGLTMVPSDGMDSALHKLGAISSTRYPNGVRSVILPREIFNAKAWDATEQSARGGQNPIGSKTLFPSHWDEPKILKAIEAVLKSPESKIISFREDKVPMWIVVEGRYEGVLLKVGVMNNQVQTAYPSWNQFPPTTIERAYKEFGNAIAQVDRQIEALEGLTKQKLPVPVATLAAHYLGKKDAPALPAGSEWLEAYLHPERLAEHQGQYYDQGNYFDRTRSATDLQTAIADYLMADATLRRVETALVIKPLTPPDPID